MKGVRHLLYLEHRYVGLAMAVFLIIVALTGSLLAFRQGIERLVAPQLYAKALPGVPRLSLIELGERAQQRVPNGTLFSVAISPPDQAVVRFQPKVDPSTGKPYDLGFTAIFIDPWTGQELVRRRRADLSQGLINLMPWMRDLHDKLLNGVWGTRFVGIIALFWLIDSFVALYLTFPPTLPNIFRHWKTSWLIKTNAGSYRLNLDLHRSFGLWLWPMILIFALSSVMNNLRSELWDPVTAKVFGARSTHAELADLRAERQSATPLREFDFKYAIAEGKRLMAERAAKEGFETGEPSLVLYDFQLKAYGYSESLRGRFSEGSITFVPGTGQVLRYVSPIAGHGRTSSYIERLLFRLHTAHTLGPVYETFVALLGLVITMFSVTGVYLWWKKRSLRGARRSSFRLPAGAPSSNTGEVGTVGDNP